MKYLENLNQKIIKSYFFFTLYNLNFMICHYNYIIKNFMEIKILILIPNFYYHS